MGPTLTPLLSASFISLVMSLNILTKQIFLVNINIKLKQNKFFLEFCLILTKYFVKTNSDWVISKVLIVETVIAQIGHDMELSFSFSPGVCSREKLNLQLWYLFVKLKCTIETWVKTEKCQLLN